MHILTCADPEFCIFRAVTSHTFTVRLAASVPFSAPGAMPAGQEFTPSLCLLCQRAGKRAAPQLCRQLSGGLGCQNCFLTLHSLLQSILFCCIDFAVKPGEVFWVLCWSHVNHNYLLYAACQFSLCNVCLKKQKSKINSEINHIVFISTLFKYLYPSGTINAFFNIET